MTDYPKSLPVQLYAWMREHDSHGLCYTDLCFLPEGDEPDYEIGHKWVRVPHLDWMRVYLADT